MTIFISIASYRDPELIPTIRDCLAKARRPDDLRFGICWQHMPGESLAPFDRDSRFRIRYVAWQDSKGACWARAECMALWQGEDHFLQIDSHHRFVEGWDELLLSQMAATGSAKPILTTYPSAYEPDAPTLPAGSPRRIAYSHFNNGILMTRGRSVPDSERPIRARFLAAGFLFAPGSFVRDVPYDPDLYFIGEEITLAVRAFSHGYDLFHPGVHILWHYYERKGQPSHDIDHVPANGVERSFLRRDQDSRRKVRDFLNAPWIGVDGLGTDRTLADYEAYAGIDFRRRLVHSDVRAGHEPPRAIDPHWADAIGTQTLSIRIMHADLATAALTEALLWRVALIDGDDVVFEQSFNRASLAARVTNDGTCHVLPIDIPDDIHPKRWTVEPLIRDGQALKRIGGVFS